MPKSTTTSKANKKKQASKSKGKKNQGSVKVNVNTAKKLQMKESDSKSGSKKKNRMAGVERGDAPNIDTAFINGTFNVKYARKDLKKFISNTLGLELGTINAQFPYSACAENLALYLVRSSGKYNTKNRKKADLYEVTLENLQRAIRESTEFGDSITALSNSFVANDMDYTVNFFDSDKVLRKFLEQQAFTNTTNVHVDNDALNFVCYIVSHALSTLTRTACILSQYGNKKNIQIKNFRYASEIHFSGELGQLMAQRITEIEGLFANKKDNANKKAKGKDGKAKKAKKESDDEDEDEDEDDNEEDEDEDDNEEDEDEDDNEEDEDEDDNKDDESDEEVSDEEDSGDESK